MTRSSSRSVRFAIIRILGDDLPPLHGSAQTENNLSFTLANEAPFQNSEKIWILNRITDSTRKARYKQLLLGAGREFFEIPFDEKAYKRSVVGAWWFWPGRPTARLAGKLRALVSLNSARNLALAIGRARAEWTLVLDGACFFSEADFNAFANAMQGRSLEGSFAIPMRRLASYSQVANVQAGQYCEEPQLVFGNQCCLKFDEEKAYGADSKVGFLRRHFPVKVKGGRLLVTAAGFTAGGVWRLPSGGLPAGSPWLRERLRDFSLVVKLARLDVSAAGRSLILAGAEASLLCLELGLRRFREVLEAMVKVLVRRLGSSRNSQ